MVRYPGDGPLFQRDHQGVLGQLLGQSHVADQARERGDDPGTFHAPDRRRDTARIHQAPNTWSTSASPSHAGHRSRCSFRNRAAHSTASSLDRTWYSA